MRYHNGGDDSLPERSKTLPLTEETNSVYFSHNHVTHGAVQPSQPQPRGPSGAYMSHFLGAIVAYANRFIILECWGQLLSPFFTANKASNPQPTFICQAQNDEKKSFQKIAKSLVLLP